MILILCEFKQTNMLSDVSRGIEIELFHFLFSTGWKIKVNVQCFLYLVLVTFLLSNSEVLSKDAG